MCYAPKPLSWGELLNPAGPPLLDMDFDRRFAERYEAYVMSRRGRKRNAIDEVMDKMAAERSEDFWDRFRGDWGSDSKEK